MTGSYQIHLSSISDDELLTIWRVNGTDPVSVEGLVMRPISKLIEFTFDPVIGVATAIVFDPILEQGVEADSNLQLNPLAGRLY